MAKVVLEIEADNSQAVKAITDTGKAFTSVGTAAKKSGKETADSFKQGADASKQANASLKDFTNNINIAGVNVGQLGSKFSGLTGGIGSIVRGFGLLKTAIIGTGIGALILGLTSLIAFFKKTEKGAEFLERATAGVGAAFDVLIGVITPIGEFIVDIFTKPKVALQELVDVIKNQLVNRFTALGVILDGIVNLDFTKVRDGALQLATGVTDVVGKFNAFTDTVKKAADAAALLEGKFQDLEDKERANSVTISKNLTLIELLRKKSKDSLLPIEERLALLDKAAKLEEQNLAIELSNANARINFIKEENAAKVKNGTLRDEDDQKLVDAILKRDALNRDSLVLQQKITNEKSALTQQAIADEAQITAAKQKALDDFAALSKQALENQLKLLDAETSQSIAVIKSRLANQTITEQEAAAIITQIKLDALNQQLEDLQASSANVEGSEASIAAKSAEIANFTADTKIEANNKVIKSNEELKATEEAITQARLDLAGTFVSGFADLLGQDEANREKYGDALKALAIAEIGINLAKELSAQAAAAGGNIFNTVTFGVAGAVQYSILSAIAIARAAFAIAKVSSQGFAKGGYTGDGGKYQEAGTVHKGEYVFTKEKTKKHKGLFDAIHNNKELSMFDLKGLLEGTGVRMKEDVAFKINKSHSDYTKSEADKLENNLKNLQSIEAKMSMFFDFYKGKPTETTDSKGNRIIKKGNSTRIIRKS